MSHDPQAIRRLTESYRTLRGLESLPFALWFLAIHSAELMGAPFDVRWVRFAAMSLGIALAHAAFAIHRYYDRRFGVVTRPARWGGDTWVLLLIAFVTLEALSAYWALPVNLGFLAVALATAVHVVRNFELEKQRLLFALIFIALSFWGRSIFDLAAPKDVWFYAGAVAIDTIWIVVTLLDHRTLVKAFERARLADTSLERPLSTR